MSMGLTHWQSLPRSYLGIRFRRITDGSAVVGDLLVAQEFSVWTGMYPAISP